MGRFLYQHPADDLAKTYAPTLVDGTIDANYPLAYLANDNPALPAKFTTTHCRIVWDLATAQLVEFVGLLHWNVLAPATVAFEAHTANTWGSPDFSTPIALTTQTGNGYVRNPFLDRSGLVSAARRYVSLVVSGNAANLVIGGVWLGTTKRSLVDPFAPGVERPTGQDSVVIPTNFNVEHAFSRARTGGIRSGVTLADSTELAAITTWGETCRWGPRAVPVVFDSAVNALDFVRWNQTELVPQLVNAQIFSVPMSFRQVSPGEAWL